MLKFMIHLPVVHAATEAVVYLTFLTNHKSARFSEA